MVHFGHISKVSLSIFECIFGVILLGTKSRTTKLGQFEMDFWASDSFLVPSVRVTGIDLLGVPSARPAIAFSRMTGRDRCYVVQSCWKFARPTVRDFLLFQ